MDYQWLKKYKENEAQLVYLKWTLDKSKSMLERWAKEDFQTGEHEKNYSIFPLKKKIQLIEEEIIQLEIQMEDAQDILSSLEETDRQIMELKYLNGLTLKDIAKKMGYSHSYIRKLHTDLKKIFVFLDNYRGKRQERIQNKNL